MFSSIFTYAVCHRHPHALPFRVQIEYHNNSLTMSVVLWKNKRKFSYSMHRNQLIIIFEFPKMRLGFLNIQSHKRMKLMMISAVGSKMEGGKKNNWKTVYTRYFVYLNSFIRPKKNRTESNGGLRKKLKSKRCCSAHICNELKS